MVQQWSVFELSLRSPWSVDEIEVHPTDEVQKFAQCGQSKTAENFRKITNPRTSGQRQILRTPGRKGPVETRLSQPSKRRRSLLVVISAERPRSAAPE
jgi:hypothetical protein